MQANGSFDDDTRNGTDTKRASAVLLSLFEAKGSKEKRSSCFVDSWGNVFPCTIYDHRLGSLRDVGYDLARIWNSEETRRIQAEIWDYRCPQCWTPCEAYQSIMGNFLRPRAAQ